MKILKKMLISMLLIITLFNFIFSSNVSYAFMGWDDPEEVINSITSVMGGIVSILYWPLRIKIVGYAFLIGEFVNTTIAKMDGGETFFVTPFDIFFNKINLTSIDFFDFEGAGETSLTFRTEVAKWYYSIRLLAIGMLIVVLVYVGINMAISTLADDKAKFKKMLVDWFMSMGLLFVMQYIIIFVIELNNVLVTVLEGIVEKSDISDFMWKIAGDALIGIGISSITSTLVYAGIVILTFGFIIAYINRMLKVGFLIIISPLITITYSIDRMKDSKAQALDTWLKEITYTILIQPFHCVIYIAYISVCLNLLIRDSSDADGFASILGSEYNQLANGVLAIFCLVFIRQAEKIVRKIFGFKDDDEKTSFGAGLATTIMVVKQAPKAGAAARGVVNKLGNAQILSKVKTDIATFTNNNKTFEKVKNSKPVQNIANSKAYANFQNAVSVANATVQKVGNKVGDMTNKVRTIANKPKKFLEGKEKQYREKAVGTGSKMAKFKANALAGLRKGNSSKRAFQAIAGMGTFVSKDAAAGDALRNAAAAGEAVDTFNKGSTSKASENLDENSDIARDLEDSVDNEVYDSTDQNGVPIKGTESTAQDIRDELDLANQSVKENKKNLRKVNNDPNATEDDKKAALGNYVAAMKHRTAVRNELTNKTNRHSTGKAVGKNSGAASVLQNIKNKGGKGTYKKNSDEENKITGAVSTQMQASLDALHQDVADGKIGADDAAKLEKELQQKVNGLMNGIQKETGHTDTFTRANVDDYIQSEISPLLAKIPTLQGNASRIADELENQIKGYREFCDERYIYSQISNLEQGGSSIDDLTRQMYNDSRRRGKRRT